MRYTQQVGREKMAMKVGLTFACMNIKKIAKILWKRDHGGEPNGHNLHHLLLSFRFLTLDYPRFAKSYV